MPDLPKREVNVAREEMTINEDGQIVVTDPAVLEAIRTAQANDDEGISINFGCVVVEV